MEEKSCGRMAADFCGELRSFCSRLETSSRSLRASIERAPAFSQPEKFIDSMNRKVQTASAGLETLKSLTVETVSFEELFGYCTILYNVNQEGVRELESQLEQYGYQQTEIVPEETVPSLCHDSSTENASDTQVENEDVSVDQVQQQQPDTDAMMESLSIEDFGLSASSLAALSTEDVGAYSPELYVCEDAVSYTAVETHRLPDHVELSAEEPLKNTDSAASGHAQGRAALERITRDEFDNAPSWLKWQVSHEILNEFILKLDTILSSKGNKCCLLTANDLSSLPYAPPVQKACLLLLVKLQRLETAFQDGATAYKPLL